jgi:hypothetical protein
MKRIISGVVVLLLFVASLVWAVDYSSYKQEAGDRRWHTKLNAFIDAVSGDMTGIYNMVATPAVGPDALILVTDTPTYSNGTTFTLLGDYSGQFTPSKVVMLDLGTDGLKTNTVASSSFGGGVTTVVLNTSNLTVNLTRLWATASGGGTTDVDPKWYGAMGDGVTDDSAAINLATTAVHNNGGGRVLFSPGTYVVDANRIQIYSNTTVDGGDPNLVTIRMTSTSATSSRGWFENADRAGGNTNIIIKNLSFYRVTQAIVAHDEHIFLSKVTFANVDNCRFENSILDKFWSSKQVDFDGCSYSVVQNCQFKYALDCALSLNNLDNSSQYILVYNCEIIGEVGGQNGGFLTAQNNVDCIGLRMYDSGCELTDDYWSGSPGGWGLKLIDCDFVNSTVSLRGMSDVLVSGCRFTNSSLNMSLSYDTSKDSGRGMVVVGNTWKDNWRFAVGGVNDNGTPMSGIVFSGNFCYGTGTDQGANTQCLYIISSKDVMVQSNFIGNAYDCAVDVENCWNVVFDGNTLENPQQKVGGNGYGLIFFACRSLVVTNNIITDKNMTTQMSPVFRLYRNAGVVFKNNSAVVYKPGVVFLEDWMSNAGSWVEKSGNSMNFVPQEVISRSASGSPGSGTWHLGTLIWNTAPASGQPMGWTCSVSGTKDTVTDSTGTTDGSTNVVTFSAPTNGDAFHVGQYVTVSNGFSTTGPFMILERTSVVDGGWQTKTLTLNAVSDSAETGLTVENYIPTFIPMPNYP